MQEHNYNFYLEKQHLIDNVLLLAFEKIQSIFKTFEPKNEFKKSEFDETNGKIRIHGLKAVLSDGEFFEKIRSNVGTNFGSLSKSQSLIINENTIDFWSKFINLILYPKNPNIPMMSIHFRIVISKTVCSFSGWVNLMQNKIDHDESKDFNNSLKEIFDRYHKGLYETMNIEKTCVNEESLGNGGVVFFKLPINNIQTDLDFIKNLIKGSVKKYSELIRHNPNKT